MAKPLKAVFALLFCASAAMHGGVVHAQQVVDEGSGKLLIFLEENSASAMVSLHINDINSVKEEQAAIDQTLAATPEVPNCTIVRKNAQDNGSQPIKTIDDSNIKELSGDTLTLILFWSCSEQPTQIDAKPLFSALPNLKSILVHSVGNSDEIGMGEHMVELLPGQSSAPLQ